VCVDDVECDSTMFATHDVLDQQTVNSNCAIIYEPDSDFGDVSVIDLSSSVQRQLLPGRIINPERFSHLSVIEREALNELKQLLIEAVKQPLNIIDMSRPFSIFTD